MAAKVVYKAQDGTEWPDADAAERRDRLVAASDAFRAAQRELTRAMLANCKTSDGEYFNDRQTRTYFAVTPAWLGMPRLREHWLYPHNLEVDIGDRDAGLVVRQFRTEGPAGGRYETLEVGKLYAKRTAAVAALKAARAAWLESCLAEVRAAECEEGP